MFRVALPIEPALPQLSLLWSDDRMAALAKQLLTPAAAHHTRLRCALKHLRYRAAERVVTLYRLQLTSPDGTPRSRWLSALSYPSNRAHRKWKSQQATFDGLIPGIDTTPFGRPFHYLDSAHTLLQLYPFDLHLPALAALSGPAPPSSVLEAIEQSAGGQRITHHRVTPVRYRPLLAATLAMDVQLETTGARPQTEQRFFIKLYGGQGAAAATERYTALARLDARTANTREVRFTRPTAFCAPLQALIFARAPGTGLDQRLKNQPPRPLLARCANALAQLHQRPDPGLTPRSRAEQLQQINHALTLIRWACPELRLALRRINLSLPLCLDEDLRCPVHLDIKPEHLMLDGEQITLLDGDSARLADPVYDIAMLALRLRYLHAATRPTESDLDYCLDAYFDAVPQAWRQRLPINRLCADLKLARSLIQHLRPHWREDVHRLVADAEQQLAFCG